MRRCIPSFVLVLSALLGCLGSLTAFDGQRPATELHEAEHAAHQAAFDRGPRQRPWVIDRIGRSHFPITTSNPEVQKWFDQGHTLIHSFWYYEAERAFRWCLKLDPNAAMAYWGLARSYYWRERDIAREAAFMREASKRKARLSDREKMYIEAWEVLYTPEAIAAQKAGGAPANEVRRRLREGLQRIAAKYPDDVEAKALLAWEGRAVSTREEMELTLQQVLAKQPDHPGALHYRIHIWDGRDAEHSRDSTMAYGRIVTGVGHALHMPGHTYSVLGMWHEAAAAMVTADHVERDYLRQRMALPFQSWNYAHNRNYLSYLQEQLGMAAAAIAGSRQLLEAPLDPAYNNPDEYGTHWQGQLALVRALIKFERWQEVLAPSTTRHWRSGVRDRMWRTYAETLAHLGLGHVKEASRWAAGHAELRGAMENPAHTPLRDVYAIHSLELRAALALARGETADAFAALGEAAPKQSELLHHSSNNDPPVFPNSLYVVLGRAHLSQNNPALAVAAFENALRVVSNDAFALAGLVEAYVAMEEKRKAADALSRLMSVWAGADPDVKVLRRVQALGLAAAGQKDTSVRRPAGSPVSRQVKADAWKPYEAPELEGVDLTGQQVSLDRYRGKYLLMIFSPSVACQHCQRQLADLSKQNPELRRRNTEVVVITADGAGADAELQKGAPLPFPVVTDANHANAKRFNMYDDFEDRPLHGTVLIDPKGRVHWARNGDLPFDDYDFLVEEIGRVSELSERRAP